MSKHIGLLGGTFNPIHHGHIALANFVHQQLQLDEMHLLPNHLPPHKQAPLVTAEHRLNMVKLAVSEHPHLRLNSIELQRDEPSYSVQTLKQLRQTYPSEHLYFVMGMDSYCSLSSWFRWQELLDLCHIVVCQRPGDKLPEQGPEAELLQRHRVSHLTGFKSELSGSILCLENPLWPISSTQIRQQLATASSAHSQIPARVAQYIAKHQLYQQLP